jgi:hypothetical protein
VAVLTINTVDVLGDAVPLLVTITLSDIYKNKVDAFTTTSVLASSSGGYTDSSGNLIVDLIPNSEISSPLNTVYLVDVAGYEYLIIKNGDPQTLLEALAATPGDLDAGIVLQGAVGPAGTSVRYGISNPTAGVGNNGDFYINTSTYYIFGPKAAGDWPAGVSIGGIGPEGPTGPQGATGAQGTPGRLLVSDTTPVGAVAGDIWFNSVSAVVYGYYDSFWVELGSGSQGPTGPQGATGAQGPTGPVGATGAAGDTGPQGLQGIAGANGPAGPQGFQGAEGAQGAQSTVEGPQGAQGAQGALGPQGPIGAQSTVEGPQGAQGAQGAVGSQGPQGFQGSNGAVGGQGAVGAQGAVGSQGAAGSQGPQGAQGDIGPQGDTGDTGAQGIVTAATAPIDTSVLWADTTTAGTAGAQGAQGAQGDVGPQGDTGAPAEGSYFKMFATTTAGRYIAPPDGWGTGFLTGVGYLRCKQLSIPTTITVDRIAVNIQAAGSAGAVVRLGIYESNNGVPGALILDAGTVDATSTGTKTITISQTLAAGYYYLAAVGQGQGSQVTGNAYSASQQIVPIDGTFHVGNGLVSYTKSGVTGALPDPLNPNMISNVYPNIQLRLA